MASLDGGGPSPQHTQHGSTDERQPLLAVAVAAGDYIDVDRLHDTTGAENSTNGVENEADAWTPPPGFAAIQLAIMANVFLAGFDGTITASTYAVISSNFGAANAASWLTTSYLVTSTAFQPLYGRVSDLVGRRACFLVSTAIFAVGCLGCAAAPDMFTLNCMRALAGLGGSGLMTMATIVNSDLIPFRRRGMYQAMQNGVFGFGAICGASFGGTMTDTIGWRWCFAIQVPVSVASFIMGGRVLRGLGSGHAVDAEDAEDADGTEEEEGAAHVFHARPSWWSRIDVTGAFLLVAGISVQLVGLSLGGNELPWSSPWVWLCLGGSVVLLALFVRAEQRPDAASEKQVPPIIPLRMLRGRLPLATQATNICVGLAAYAYLFSLPLFFQVVLQDSPTRAGARLAIPALATPIGGLISGVVMSRWNGSLATLVRTGACLMVVGNSLVASFGFNIADTGAWKYFVYTIPANLGQGIVYPGLLFTSLATFDHADHAVSASAVYLVRSLGMVWGVAITSAIVQTTLSTRLPEVLRDSFVDGDQLEQIVNDLRHSVAALYDLPPELQRAARHVYYEGLQYSFTVSAVVAGVALASSLLIHSNGLRNTSGTKN
ncbi:major facilitator superfamily transporter [Ophiostoma piceae UAMH 11346]|uniref:Major facilitator superfamily transporter n=1 Tax=Ophiostoma piceae (strain UAMH 11346) TaxID=1262450 RepID=S3CJX2_OPHP1|nr:major facilitator superfamily transporter [Ophiostoma piceae UAMH 11346]